MATGDFQAVLLDMDGVLLDSMQQHCQSWLEIMGRNGLTVSRGFVLEHEGCLGTEVLEKIALGQGVSFSGTAGDFMNRLLEQQRELYMSSYMHTARAFPQAPRLLEVLRRAGLPAALVTSSRRELVDASLPPEITGALSAVVTSGDVARHKPHPEPYQAAARALGVEPARCLVVENAPAGIEAALAAGATCYAVCSTLPAQSLARAHKVFQDLGQVAEALAS